MRPARPLFIDGRKLPGDPSPVWQGYSVGRWEGDTLVIETAGFNKRTITITDPQTFTKPIRSASSRNSRIQISWSIVAPKTNGTTHNTPGGERKQ